MHETGHSKLVLWNNPEVWAGEGVGGREFRMGDTCTPVAIHVSVWQDHHNIVR